MLHTAAAQTGPAEITTTPILRFVVKAPGTKEPDMSFTHRWMAEREATRLQEEHGYDSVVVPTIVHEPFNPWK